MFLIHCPYCGESRAEEEFHAVGEAHIRRPADPAACSDTEWGDYLYFRDNPRGEYREMWVHAAGCRKHFNLARDTMSYAILGSYRIGETFEVPSGSGGGGGWQEVGASVPAAETPPARSSTSSRTATFAARKDASGAASSSASAPRESAASPSRSRGAGA